MTIDENNVNIDTSNDTETTVNATSTAEEEIAKLKETNAKLFERAKKAEGFVRDADGNWVKKEQPKPQATISEQQTSQVKPYNILEDEVFDFINEGYSKEEIRFIQANGGRKSLEDQNSLVAIAVKTKRDQRKAEEAAAGTSDKSSQSEIERKYTPEQMRNMKPDELAKLIGFAN